MVLIIQNSGKLDTAAIHRDSSIVEYNKKRIATTAWSGYLIAALVCYIGIYTVLVSALIDAAKARPMVHVLDKEKRGWQATHG